jgi:hypothetical protein
LHVADDIAEPGPLGRTPHCAYVNVSSSRVVCETMAAGDQGRARRRI